MEGDWESTRDSLHVAAESSCEDIVGTMGSVDAREVSRKVDSAVSTPIDLVEPANAGAEAEVAARMNTAAVARQQTAVADAVCQSIAAESAAIV